MIRIPKTLKHLFNGVLQFSSYQYNVLGGFHVITRRQPSTLREPTFLSSRELRAVVFRLWGSEMQQNKPGRDSIISITAKYRSPAHHDGFNYAKRMISCNSISQERSRKVAYALTISKTSGNNGLLIVSWWWRKAFGCVPWYSSDSERMGKGFSIQVWTVCDNVTEGTNPCCVEGFGGHSQWHLLPQCPNKRKCKVGSM